MNRILLADDDKSLRGVVAFALRDQGYEVEEAADGKEAWAAYRGSRPDLVITDLKMPGMDGMALLRAIREEEEPAPVIVLTAFGTIEQAVEAMKMGAFNYLTKPYNREELRIVVRNALDGARLRAENRNLKGQLREHTRRIPFVYASSSMEELVETVQRVAATDATVLITGESGTGKELVAHSLHELSDRWERAFVPVNCGALPKDLVESELFGYKKGAFTGATRDKPGKFQVASGGTLFLDEIGELSLDLQSKLLRVLETGQVDVLGGEPVTVNVRLVAASNSNLARAAREGTFREDLFYRLNVIPLHVPPLRERREDIPALWEHFVKLYAPGESVRTAPDLMEHLLRLAWKGNVRELANLCQRMILLRKGDRLRLEDLPAGLDEAPVDEELSIERFVGVLPERTLPLREVEREIVRRALEKFGGNKSRAAKYLQIPRHVLLYRIDKFGLDREGGERDTSLSPGSS